MESISNLLKHGYNTLSHLETPLLDSEVLLAHVLGKPREYVLTHSEDTVSPKQKQQFENLLARRVEHEPVAYLINQKEFYGRPFYVDNRVHIPKPATEDLIDAIKEQYDAGFDGTFADIGTGSGCIAVTLALEFPKATVIATDISKDALAVAEKNAQALGAQARIALLNVPGGGMFNKPIDIVAANLPYGWPKVNRSLGGGWTEDREVFFQPEISYLAGTDGLDAISALMRQLPDLLTKHGRAYLEFDPRQAGTIKTLATESAYASEIIKDASGFDRILRLTN